MSVVNDRALAINLLESFLYIQRPIIPPFFCKKASAPNTLSFNTPALATVETPLGLSLRSSSYQRDKVLQSK